MSKKYFKISNSGNQFKCAKSPIAWMLTLEDIPKNKKELEIDLFAEDLRLFKFEEMDFIASKI